MKHAVAAILFFCFCVTHANAQLVQVIAGIPYSQNIVGDGLESTSGDALLGYKAGISADFFIARSMSLQPGLLYTQWGSRFPGYPDGKTATLRLNYLQMPILIKNYFRLSHSTRWQLGLGLYTACRTNEPKQAITLGKRSNHTVGTLEENNVERIYRRMDYGLVFNTSFILRNRANITFQYDHGFFNILKRKTDLELYNRSVSVSVGYYINARKIARKRLAFWNQYTGI